MLTRAQETGVTDVAGAPALITTAVGDEHTAPLPRRFGWPLALAASLAILVPLGAGAVWYQVHQQQSRQAAIVQQAEEVLGQARLAYQEGRFDEAKGLYQSVAEQWPAESAVGRRARGGVLAAQGRIDLDAGQYDAAVEAFERLDALGVMDRQRVRDLIDEAHRRSAFAQAMSQIEQAIADQQFAQARQELRSWRDLDLTELEEQKLGELAAVLEDQQARLEQQQVLAQAEALVEAGLRDRAIELLGAAIQRSPSLELQARHDQLVAEREHEAALLRASTAEAAGRLEEAAAAYAEALQARPDDAVAQKLAELQSRMALEQGLRELAAGNLPAAEAALIRSLGYQDNARAREALSQIQSTNRASVFLQAGDQAMAQGDYETAVKQYDNALALSDDPPLRAKRDEAMFRWQMTRSFEALRTGHVEQAKEALDQLASMRPQDPTLTAAMAELAAYQEYWGHIQAGDEARARSDFGEATRQYRMALEVLDTPQVRQRLDETEFAKLLAQARGYIAIEEYASARAMLQIAAKIRSSPEIEELQAEIGRRLTRERSPR
ncbi:MAG TPA: tetratricopeptide repeat protein, partial [Phycisphaeraceae bacterium]